MKKCDFHIHTVPTVSDSAFKFSLDVLKDYVSKMKLDVIAITNHNVFDMNNYITIKDVLAPVIVLPGIEVDLEGGHILVISSEDDAEMFDFSTKCDAITRKISSNTDVLTLSEFQAIFTDLSKYLLIPHYDKSPSLPKPIIERLSAYIFAGEVSSVKKFLYMQKDEKERLTPVIFSDFRCAEGVQEDRFPIRQTYLDIDEVGIQPLNMCLNNKKNAALSATEGFQMFEIFSNGQMLSTGLNIMYGRRSTGKTWTLNKIAEQFGDRAKYIKQFELQNYGRPYTSEQFEDEQKVRLESEVASFLRPFKETIEDIVQIPEHATDDYEVENYLRSLLKRSEMENINDVFSNSFLYQEILYSVGGTTQLRKVIDAVITLIESNQYHDVISNHISDKQLKELLKELIEKLRSIEYRIKCKKLTNALLTDVQDALQLQTALPAIPIIDLYAIAKRQKQRKKFVEIVAGIKKERIIYNETMLNFRIILSTKVYGNATEVKSGQGIAASLVSAFYNYNEPLIYLRKLVDAGIETSKLYKLFVGIKYNILNNSGLRVSGGEQSEFIFLQKIKDARTKDILLIDEPESSFDNMFLKKDINKFIMDIAAMMPVVVSTHNNTIGGSIQPNYVLYTEKRMEGGQVSFRLYSGKPTDEILKTVDGEETENYQITIESLEAGEEAYNERKKKYGILKDYK